MASAEGGPSNKGGPVAVPGVAATCGLHIVGAAFLLAHLEPSPVKPLGVFVTPTEQVWWGVWVILGLVLVPTAAGAVLFEMQGVLEWYGHYLVASITMLLIFLIRVALEGSVCQSVVPATVQNYSSAAVCAIFDMTATTIGLLALGALSGVVLWLFHVAQRLHSIEPELPIPAPYGTFANDEKLASRVAPFRVPPAPPRQSMKEEALRRMWEQRVREPRGPGENPHERRDQDGFQPVPLPEAGAGAARSASFRSASFQQQALQQQVPRALSHSAPGGNMGPMAPPSGGPNSQGSWELVGEQSQQPGPTHQSAPAGAAPFEPTQPNPFRVQ